MSTTVYYRTVLSISKTDTTEDTVDGQQLYPTSRTDAMDIGDLRRVLAFAQTDITDGVTVYADHTRAETVATARQSVVDLRKAIAARGADHVRETTQR